MKRACWRLAGWRGRLDPATPAALMEDLTTFESDLSGVDWDVLKQVLATDRFDNGRTPDQLRRSFQNSTAAIVARAADGRVIGTARVLSDGVCNAYLIDVWTLSEFRRRGVARTMIEMLLAPLRGQHVYLQADPANVEFYRKLGFRKQRHGMSRVVGTWLVNDDNQDDGGGAGKDKDGGPG